MKLWFNVERHHFDRKNLIIKLSTLMTESQIIPPATHTSRWINMSWLRKIPKINIWNETSERPFCDYTIYTIHWINFTAIYIMWCANMTSEMKALMIGLNVTNKHGMLTQRCFIVGPASQTVDQHWTDIGSIFRVRWEHVVHKWDQGT